MYQRASKWGKIRHGIQQGSLLGPLLFLLYINDLPSYIRNKSKPILFADDTSIIVANSSPKDFIRDIMAVFEQLNKWFSANNFLLNFGKTHIIQFTSKNGSYIDLDVSYANNKILKMIQNFLEYL
jgi:glutathionyl-hydroquinone reductase